MNLQGIRALTQITFAASYQWEVEFPDAPPPFDSWFPVNTVDVPVYNLASETVRIGNYDYRLPAGKAMPELNLTFYDNAELVLTNWLEEWADEISPAGTPYVSALATAVRTVRIKKLNRKREVVANRSYAILPEGEVRFVGNSERRSALMYTAEFTICGEF